MVTLPASRARFPRFRGIGQSSVVGGEGNQDEVTNEFLGSWVIPLERPGREVLQIAGEEGKGRREVGFDAAAFRANCRPVG